MADKHLFFDVVSNHITNECSRKNYAAAPCPSSSGPQAHRQKRKNNDNEGAGIVNIDQPPTFCNLKLHFTNGGIWRKRMSLWLWFGNMDGGDANVIIPVCWLLRGNFGDVDVVVKIMWQCQCGVKNIMVIRMMWWCQYGDVNVSFWEQLVNVLRGERGREEGEEEALPQLVSPPLNHHNSLPFLPENVKSEKKIILENVKRGKI